MLGSRELSLRGKNLRGRGSRISLLEHVQVEPQSVPGPVGLDEELALRISRAIRLPSQAPPAPIGIRLRR